MKILIIEDEKPAAEKLIHKLNKLRPSFQVLETLDSISSAAEWFSGHDQPDLIFMDIQLADGVCFELFDLVKIETPIIFTTAYNEYAIRAFKVNSIDYLLKPYQTEDLVQAISKFESLYGQAGFDSNKVSKEINQLSNQLINSHKKRFFVKRGQHYSSIPTETIESFFSLNKSTFLKTKEGKTYDIEYSLERLEELVPPDNFFRINRNHIINIQTIKDVIIYSGSRLKVKLNSDDYDEELIVSRDKVNSFKKWMDH